MKKILILNANPVKESFCEAIATTYYKEAISAGHEARIVHIADVEFNPSLYGGYKFETPVEDSLKRQQENILWCEHLVIVTPNWWSGVPAVFKGFIDRVFLPHFAFAYKSNGMVEGLLKGRSARVFITQDSPKFWSRCIVGDPLWRMLKRGTLSFCGIKPVSRTIFCIVRKSDEKQRAKWLQETKELAKKGE